jgi:hypothetical protein
VKSVLKSNHWGNHRRNEYTSSFWLALLTDPALQWNSHAESLKRKVLTIASGSIVDEQGFSSFGIVKNLQRNRLSNLHLEAILKVLLNGPSTIKEFDSQRYAKAYIRSGKFHPDKPPPGREEDDKEMLDSDSIYGDDDQSLLPLEIEDVNPLFDIARDININEFVFDKGFEKRKQKITSFLT